jgi:hypothetical protein
MPTQHNPFQLPPNFVPPPARAPMPTLSIDVDFDAQPANEARGSDPDVHRDSSTRVRCWCSED